MGHLLHMRLAAALLLALAGRARAGGEKFNGVCYASWATAGADSYDSVRSHNVQHNKNSPIQSATPESPPHKVPNPTTFRSPHSP